MSLIRSRTAVGMDREGSVSMETESWNSNKEDRKMCKCGTLAPLWTSWSLKNPGRRFIGCPNYMNDGYCRFFQWIDPSFCARATEIIHQTRSSMLESKIDNSKLTEKVAKIRNKSSALNKENEEMKREVLRLRTDIVNHIEGKKYWFRVAMMLMIFIISLLLFSSAKISKSEKIYLV